MPTIIETVGEYRNYIEHDKGCKPETIRGIDQSLRSFTKLYGIMEVTELKATDIQLFFDLTKRMKRKKKNSEGEHSIVTASYVHKVMKHIKSYVRWLSEKGYTKNVAALDVPTVKLTRRFPAYLTKEEMKKILQYLESLVEDVQHISDARLIYAAHLWRALIRFLYTTGLRNFEIRKIQLSELHLEGLSGETIGKGDKLAVFTYNEMAREKLLAYLAMRKKMFPGKRFQYIFTPYGADVHENISAYGVNRILKKVAERVGIEKNIYAHLLRHSLATHLVGDGRNIVHVREKLRHTNVSVTSIYTHSNPETLLTMTQKLGEELMPDT